MLLVAKLSDRFRSCPVSSSWVVFCSKTWLHCKVVAAKLAELEPVDLHLVLATSTGARLCAPPSATFHHHIYTNIIYIYIYIHTHTWFGILYVYNALFGCSPTALFGCSPTAVAARHMFSDCYSSSGPSRTERLGCCVAGMATVSRASGCSAIVWKAQRMKALGAVFYFNL